MRPMTGLQFCALLCCCVLQAAANSPVLVAQVKVLNSAHNNDYQTHMHTRTQTRKHANTHTHIHTYTHTHIHTYTHTHIHTYTQPHNHTTTQPHNHTTTQPHNHTTTRPHEHTNKRTNEHTNTQTHILVYTCTCSFGFMATLILQNIVKNFPRMRSSGKMSAHTWIILSKKNFRAIN